MRAAAIALLLAGCGSSEELLVTVGAVHVAATLVDLDCSCNPRLELGECRTFDDSDSLCDRCETSCPEITATRGTDRAVLVLDGCGKHAELAIPTEFPEVLVATATAIDGGTRVSWEVDAMTTQVYLSGYGGSTAEECLLRPQTNTYDLHRTSFLGGGIALAAENFGPPIETPFGSTRVRADSGVTRVTPPSR